MNENTKNNTTTIKSRLAKAACAAAAALALPLLMALGTAGTASAAPIVYSTGFEVGEGYGVGAPLPQNGWTREDGVAVTPPLSTPNIKTDSPAFAGAQSLNIINNPNNFNQLDPGSVSYAISPVASLVGPDVLATGNRFVHIEWYMRVDDPATSNTSDTWALDVYDSTGLRRTASVARGVEDAGFGQQPRVYTTDITGQYSPLSIGSAPASTQWGKYEIDMDYVLRKFTVSLNGTPLAFNQDFYALSDNGLDVNFTVNGRGTDAAYFDNFSVSVTPEHGTAGTMLIAGMVLLARRGRRNATAAH